MRRKLWLAVLYLSLFPALNAQNRLQNDFPLQVTINSIENFLIPMPADIENRAATLGVSLPGFLLFHGLINGEDHWVFTCRKEVEGRESVPCTLIPTGEYRGRWVHNHSLIQVIGGPADSPVVRFFTVSMSAKNPPSADDPSLLTPAFEFRVKFPKGRAPSDYPFLIHTYWSVSLEVPVGQLPGRSRCDAYTWSPYQTTVNCTATAPVEIHRGYVTADFSLGAMDHASMSCWAKWRWSHCAALAPGLYYARTEGKNKLLILTHDESGNPKEIGFEPHLPNESELQSPIK